MTARRGLFVNIDGSSNGTAPSDSRLALASLVADDGTSGLAARNGVFYDGQGNVVSGNTDTGTMSYSVRACQFALYLLGTVGSGAVVGSNDAVFKATTTAAPGSNSRIDVIWVRQHAVASGDGGSDSDNIMQLGVTQGTAAASPTVPAIPTGAMALAQAVMPAGATSTNALTITQVHNWTTTHGSSIPVRNQTERDAMTPFASMGVYRLDTGHPELYDGTRWHWSPQTYAPAWTASTTNPAIGNGSIVGNYQYDGSFIDFDITVTAGSTTTYGTGTFYFLTLPVAAVGNRKIICQGTFWDSSLTTEYIMQVGVNGSTQLTLFQNTGALTAVFGPTTPVAPAVGDQWVISGRYRWQ